MAIKNPDNIITRASLQNVSMRYQNEEYVAERVFPLIDGVNRKAKIVKDGKSAWFRDEAEERGRGSAARLIQLNVNLVSIDPVNYAAAFKIPDEDRQDADEPGSVPLQPDMDALEMIADKLDLKKEIRTNAAIQAADWSGVGVGGEDAAGAWGHLTAASDTFLADMQKGRDKIRSKTGKIPKTLLLDYKTWSKLQVAPALLNLTNPTKIDASNPLLTVSTLAILAQVDEIIIGSALKATNEETALDADSEFTGIDVWGNSDNKGMGFLFYRPARVGLKQLSAGYQYRVRQINGKGRASSSWRNPGEHSDYYDTNENLDIVAAALDCGYLWKDTILT